MALYEQILERTAYERERYRKREEYLTRDEFMAEYSQYERKKIPDRLATFFLGQISDNISELLKEAEAEGNEERYAYLLSLYKRYWALTHEGAINSEITFGELPQEAQYFYLADDEMSEEDAQTLAERLKREWEFR